MNVLEPYTRQPIGKVAEELRRCGVAVTEKGKYLKITAPKVEITVESRPTYCDRGNFLVKVFSREREHQVVDSQDGFPRYYFSAAACATEVYLWMSVRGILAQ